MFRSGKCSWRTWTTRVWATLDPLQPGRLRIIRLRVRMRRNDRRIRKKNRGGRITNPEKCFKLILSFKKNRRINTFLGPFRYFRIAQNGKNSSNQTYYLSLSGFEIYGQIVDVVVDGFALAKEESKEEKTGNTRTKIEN